MALSAPQPLSPAPGAPVSGVVTLAVSPSVETPDPVTLVAQAGAGTAGAADAALALLGSPQTLIAQAAAATAGAADATLTVGAPPSAGEDFESFVVGAAPAGFAEPWSTALAPTIVDLADGDLGKVLQYPGGTGRQALQWQEPGEIADGELLALIRTDVDPGSSLHTGPGVVVRGAGATGSESGYYANFIQNSGRKLALARYSNGANLSLQTVAYEWPTGGWQWMRLRFQGTSLQVRVWARGSSEPETWTITATNSTLTTGWVGLFAYENMNGTYVRQCAYLDAVSGSGTVPVPAWG